MTEPDRASFVSGLVLAAGASSRMGRPKQLLPLAGRPLLRHALEAALGSRLDEVLVVLGHGASEVEVALREGPMPDRLRLVRCADHGRGLSASLRAGVRAADARAGAVAILLGDQPGVTAALIDSVLEAAVRSSLPLARPIHRAADGTDRPGHPVVVRREMWSKIEGLSGDRGLRDWLPGLADRLLEVSVEGAVPVDVDTPEEYRDIVDAHRGLG